jgi:hypothetical protein
MAQPVVTAPTAERAPDSLVLMELVPLVSSWWVIVLGRMRMPLVEYLREQQAERSTGGSPYSTEEVA